MIGGKTKRATAALLAGMLVLAAASPAGAVNSVLLSALLPGLGQAQDGHYTRATIFATAAIASWTGLFATQINYNRSVERYENNKRNYLYYETTIDNGGVVDIDDVNTTYTDMESAWDESEDNEKWRNLFVGTLIATYALNLVDILLSEPKTGEIPEATETSLEWSGDGFFLVRTFRF